MAEVKKYLSLERLAEYDALLKAKIAQDDASTLEAAKEYADGLIEGVNTSITNITNGDVVVKEAEHATSADSATSAESATKATQDGNGAVIADTYETKADASAKLDEAKEYTDALKTYVGTIPETATATDVIGYVQEKTSGIATSENLQELTNRVAQAETDIDNIQKDYLTSADKTELQTNINTVSSAVELLTNGVNAETVDGVNDLIAYVNEHGTEVVGMKADIKANADALAGLAEVAKTGSWNDLADKPFYEEGSGATIEWDGNTEGKDSFTMTSGAVLYKVSDLTPAKSELVGSSVVANNGTEVPITEDVLVEGSNFLNISVMGYVAYEAGQITDDYGASWTVPSTGVYFADVDGTYISKLTYGSVTVHTLDEKFIPDTIARTTDLTTLESSLNTTISGKAAQGDLDSAVERIGALEAIDHDAYIAADEALKNELDGDIADLAAAIEDAKTDASNKDAVVLAEAQKATAAVSDRVTVIETWHENFVEISEEDINGLFA